MTSSHTGCSTLSDGIDLIDEYDGRSPLSSLSEEVSYACCTHSDEHLDEF
jgi:hypothetical protein